MLEQSARIEFSIVQPDHITLYRSPRTRPAPAANHSWIEVFRHAVAAQEGVHIGCWFFPLLSPYSRGSGIFINTGRTLVMQSRAWARQFFRRARMANGNAHSASTTFRGYHLKELDDSLWAEQAHAWGYDSVQILSGFDGMPEILVSRLSCLNQRRGIGACAPIPMRTGEAASRECLCKEQGMRVLNCDRTPSWSMERTDESREHERRHET